MRSALSLASRAPREPVHRIVHCGVKRAAETGYLLLAHRVECLSVRIVRRYMEPVKGNPEAERSPTKGEGQHKISEGSGEAWGFLSPSYLSVRV